MTLRQRPGDQPVPAPDPLAETNAAAFQIVAPHTPGDTPTTYFVHTGPALVYLATNPSGRGVVYRADYPDQWVSATRPTARDRGILRALLTHALEQLDAAEEASRA